MTASLVTIETPVLSFPVVTQKTAEIVDRYIASLDLKENSKELYRRTLRQYFVYLETKGLPLNNLSRVDILQYKDCLLSSGKSSLTVGSYLTSLRKFYEWTEAEKIYPNIAKGIKTPARKKQFKKQPLRPEEATALIGHFELRKEEGLRDLAIVNLLLRTGLRTIEVVRANVEDIVYKGGKRVLLVHGKGRDEKDSFVILTDKAFKPIEDYLHSREGVKGKDPLFCSYSNQNSGKVLTTRTVSKIAKEGLTAIGLSERVFTAHSLRHTAIVNCRRAGGTPEQAQMMARHSSPVTTQIYDEFFREEERIKNSGEDLIDTLY
jgi:integrase/recombinase XerC/integrase/recombinase XerD